ncbi:phage head closure protein [Alistipes sp.]|uniref:phage head closure protein n=1 Tax=Alistipes sp. TaxID=1872444 RepID=UPI003AF14228
MFDTRIELLEFMEERDGYNDLTKSLRRVAVCYAQRTENGGRENLYAGRIVHENEVVYTIRYQPNLRPDMIVRDDGWLRKIVSIHEEGRCWRLHLKCTKSDADDSSEQDVTLVQNSVCRC